jgi:hypothetical protein
MSSTNEARCAAWHRRLRQRLLQWAFPLTMTWLLFLGLMTKTEGVLRMNPFPEGGMPHRLFEDWVEPFAAVVILATIIGLHYRLLRRWPGFLCLPASAPLLATVIRLVVHGAGLFVIVTVGAVLVPYLFYDPATDPQGQFHLWAWAGGFLYAAALAPLVALFTVWRAARHKHGNRMKQTEAL